MAANTLSFLGRSELRLAERSAMKLRRREATEAQIPSRRLHRCRLQRLEDPIERAHSLLQEAKHPARPLGEAHRLGAAPVKAWLWPFNKPGMQSPPEGQLGGELEVSPSGQTIRDPSWPGERAR